MVGLWAIETGHVLVTLNHVVTKKHFWSPQGLAIEKIQSPNLVATKIFSHHKREVCHMFLESPQHMISPQHIEGFPKTYDKAPFPNDQKILIA
jgi:hypothetical protein